LNRSLGINPPSYFGHFYLARTLYDLSFDSPSYENTAFQEFRKAADLAGENTQVFYEVGKVLLSQWHTLPQEKRNFTVEMLNKVFEGKDEERIRSLFYVWEMDVGDYAVMETIFPEDAQIYADFAGFLGERSLSLEERYKYLAQAEMLDFRRAQEIFEAGERARFHFRFKQAETYYRSCRQILRNIHFYQEFFDLPNRIDMSRFEELDKQILLNLGKIYLEQGSTVKNIPPSLWEYLEKEESAAAAADLEAYLEKIGLLKRQASAHFDEWDRLSLKLYLSFKQGRFRDNIRDGLDFLRRFNAVPEEQKAQFIKILEIVGESYQRVDYVYDSSDFYEKALRMDPENMEILLKLRGNFQRVNALEEIQEMNQRISEIVSPPEIEENRSLKKGESHQRDLVLEGRKIDLGIRYGSIDGPREPLITVLFNGRVVWEDYLKESEISIPVESRVGGNRIQVIPRNRGIELEKILWVAGEQSEI
jgi:hypothetical protein